MNRSTLAIPFLGRLAAGALALAALHATAQTATAPSVRLILVGDSTIAPNGGYGDALCKRLPHLVCVNMARAGRSSASYRAEGKWDEVRALLANGKGYAANYVLVQFGHNDQPGKPGRSTDLATEFPANMERYARETVAAGAKPVLVTPLARRTFADGKLTDTLAPWADATRVTATATQSTLIDLRALSSAAFTAMGAEGAAKLAPPPKKNANGDLVADTTHLGDKGAEVISALMAAELVKRIPALAPPAAQP